MGLQATGIGSGIDVGSLVDQLVAAEGAPKSLRMNTREAELTAKLSSMGAIKSAISSFKSSFLNLTLGSTYSVLKTTSSDDDIFTATATNSAAVGTYTIDVLSVAQGQVLTTDATYAAADTDSTVVGTGTLTFEFDDDKDGNFDGTGTIETVTISGGTLNDIRDSINDADIGVAASIVYNGTAYQLSLAAESGAAKSMKVTVVDGVGTPITDPSIGLGQFAYDPVAAVGSGQNMTETLAAADASILFNGVSVTSSSNTITNPVDGIELTLKAADAGVVKTLTLADDTSKISSATSAFVTSFNELITSLNTATFYDADSGTRGLFLGDSVIRNIENQVRNVLNQTVGDNTVKYNSMASIGITTSADGTLEFDTAKLGAALAEDAAQVRNLFAGNASVIDENYDAAIAFSSIPTGVETFEVDVLITQAATQAQSYGARLNETVLDGITALTSSNFDITVDGNLTSVVLNGQMFSSGNDLASYIQNAVGVSNLTVTYANDKLTFSSTSYGSASTIDISNAEANAAANLGISNTASTATGLDVAGKLGFESATGSGQILTADAGTTYAGLVVTFTGTSSTFGYEKTKVDGLFSELNTLLSSFLDSDGILAARNKTFNNQIDDIKEQRTQLGLRMDALETRLLRQFNAMDTLVARLNSTGTFLTSQLSSLQGLANRVNK